MGTDQRPATLDVCAARYFSRLRLGVIAELDLALNILQPELEQPSD